MIKKLVASKTSPPIRALVTAMVVSGKLSVTTSWGQYTHTQYYRGRVHRSHHHQCSSRYLACLAQSLYGSTTLE